MKIIFPTIYGRTREQKFSLGALKVASQIATHHEIVLMSFSDSEKEDVIVAEIIKTNPNVVGFGVYLWNEKLVKNVSRKLKESNQYITIVCGGPIITKLATCADYDGCDMFVRGEGELPLAKIIRALECEEQGEVAKVSEIFGVSTASTFFEKKDEVSVTSVSDIYPVYGSVDLPFNRYSDETNWRYVWWETSRGCIYKCAYCDHDNQLKKFRSLNFHVLKQEFEAFIKHNTEVVYVVDPIFGGRREHAYELLEYIGSTRHRMYISCFIRPEFLTEHYISLLANARIAELHVGIQTTNVNVPKWIRNNNYEKIFHYLPMLTKAGLCWRAHLIIGLPGDDMTGLRESLRFFIEAAQPSTIKAHHLSVIPGTPLEQEAMLLSEEWLDWDADSLSAEQSHSYTSDELVAMVRLGNCYCSLYNTVKTRWNGNVPSALKTEGDYYKVYQWLETQENTKLREELLGGRSRVQDDAGDEWHSVLASVFG